MRQLESPNGECRIRKKKIAVYCTNHKEDKHRGADKSLARPGRKQATATEDFDVHISYLLS